MKYLLILSLLIVELFSNELNFTKFEKEYIKNNPILTVQNESDWKPYNYNLNGEPMGLSIDYMNLLASKLNIKIKFLTGHTWKEYLTMLKNNEIDILTNIAKTPQREKFYTYTSKYSHVLSSLYVLNNIKSYKSLEDLDGKTISVVEGMVGEYVLRKNYPNIKIYPTKNSLEALKAVIYGKADGVIQANSVGSILIKKYKLYDLKPIFEINDSKFNMHLHLATNKNNTVLKDILEKGKKLISQEEIATLHKKHFEKTSSLLNQNQLAYLNNKKNIKLCTNPNRVPLSSFKDGIYSGISADIYKIISQKLPISITPIATKNWEESLILAQKGECDIFDIAIKTPNKEKYLNFTSNFIDIPLVIVTDFEKPFIYGYETLKEKTIAITKGYAIIELLKAKYPFLNIMEVESIEQGLKFVKEGKVFGYIGFLPTVAHVIKKDYTDTLKVAGKFDELYSMGSAVRSDDKILLEILEKTINSIPKEQIQNLVNKWINIKYEKGFDYALFYKIFAFIFIIVLFLIYRFYVEKRVNKKLAVLVDKKTQELQYLNQNLENKVNEQLEELRKKDIQLLQQAKMASMGEMIGYIAHQWRQPLSVITTCSSTIKMNNELDELDDKIINEMTTNIDKNAQYLSKTIDLFRDFIKTNDNIENILVQDAINQIISIVDNSLKNNKIELIKQIDLENPIKIKIIANELNQVILNILNNSIYILKEKKISTPWIKICLIQNPDFFTITIEDNGRGIDENLKDNIFEPYVTTKHESVGTGLGLHIVYKIIVDKYHGKVYAENTNFGAKFFIQLKN